MTLKTFFEECRKRKIFKGFSIYAIVSWLIIQVAATTFPYLGIPRSAVSFIIIMVLIGLPISLIFSWYYNIIPDENQESKTKEEDEFEKQSASLFKYIILFISTAVLAIVIFLTSNIFKNSKPDDVSIIPTDKIAVIEFDNNTGDPEFDMLGKAAADWLSHGIVEHNLGKVISSEIVQRYQDAILVTPKAEVLNKILTPKRIITGDVYKINDELIIKGQVKDGLSNETIYAFPEVKTAVSNPIKGIEDLQTLVLGYIATDEKPEFRLQNVPPKYEAYKLMLEAKELSIYDERVLDLLNKALQIDSNFFEAHVYKVSYFYNNGNFETADSLRKTIRPNSNSNFRQSNLLAFYEALLSGKNKVVYERWKNEYNHAPFSLPDNSTMMTIALQYVNKPRDIQQIFDEIDMSRMNIQNCEYCLFRLYIKSLADIELQNYRSAIMTLQPHIQSNVSDFILKPLITAYVRSLNHDLLNDLFQELPHIMVNEDWKKLYLHTGMAYLLTNQKNDALPYLEEALKQFKIQNDLENQAFVNMLLENFEEAKSILETYSRNNELSLLMKTRLASCYYKLGENEKGKSLEMKIDQDRRPYDLGATDYLLAKIYSYQGNKEKSLSYLQRAVEQGHVFSAESFQNDVTFKDFWYDPKFQDILKYWH